MYLTLLKTNQLTFSCRMAFDNRVFGFSRQNGGKEEHDIELIWSFKSGKTRIFWNKCKISSIIREGGEAGVVEFTWKINANDTLKVIAHSSITDGAVRQYDLLVNGVSFFELSTLSELVRKNNEAMKASKETRCDTGPVRGIDSCDSLDSILSLEYPTEIGIPSSSSFRLAMVGLQSEIIDDELRSELYSSSLDEVRLSVTSFLPQTEDMLSRAIMEVFIGDDDTGHSSSSSFLCAPRDEDCFPLEVYALHETLEWMRSFNERDLSCQEDREEMAIAFLQKQITNTIRQIRNEQTTSHTAIRIIVGVAELLDIPFVRPMVQDTVILEGNFRQSGEHRKFLSRFGIVERFFISRKSPQFACCRFVNEMSVAALLKAARDKQLPENVSQIRFITLSHSAISKSDDLSERDDSEVMTKPHLLSHDQQTASSTCASPQSQCSIYSHILLKG
jgi:hypothetical protein